MGNKPLLKTVSKKTIPFGRNEIILNCGLAGINKLIKKHGGKLDYDDFGKKIKILTISKDPLSFDDLDSDNKSVFFFSEKEQKLIINKIVNSSFLQIDLGKFFFEEIAKYSTANFKISFLNRDKFELVFCIKDNNKIQFETSSIESWEDPKQFEEYPYFLKLAKINGLKKTKDDNGDKLFDSEEIYDLIYDFRDNLLSGDDTYLSIAPEWYLLSK
jgi:hypothetical protein